MCILSAQSYNSCVTLNPSKREMVAVQSKWMLFAVAGLLILGTTVAMAQQTGCIPVNVEGMTDQQRAQQGYHYDPETGEWYAPDDAATRLNEQTGRHEDTSFPGWGYDPQTRRWYDESRPGWSYDPVGDRWYSEDRPGEAYDLRTGRWYDEQTDQARMQRDFEYDEENRRWYDGGARYNWWEDQGASYYFDEETGRWRNQPMQYRTMNGQGGAMINN